VRRRAPVSRLGLATRRRPSRRPAATVVRTCAWYWRVALDAQKREPTAQSGSEMRILGYRQLSIVLALPLAADGARASRWRACCAACAPPMPRRRCRSPA
jgi:hypothetical protein